MNRWIILILLMFSVAAGATVLPPQQWLTVQLSDHSLLDVRPYTAADALSGNLVVMAETRDGVLLLEENGLWYYARQTAEGHWYAGEPLLSGDIPASPAGRTLSSSVSSAAAFTVQSSTADVPQRYPYRYQAELNPGGFEQPLLVVRVAFADQEFTYTDAEVAQRFFASAQSVQAFYLENSYQQFRIVPARESSAAADDGIVQVTLTASHPDFGNGYSGASQALAQQALAAAAAYVDLPAYDRNQDGWLDPNELALVVMVAGYEQAYGGAATTHPRVWAHKATTYQAEMGGYYFGEYALFGEQHQDHLATIGLFCHELGHLLFDLPDLYDTSGDGMGIGRWGLMGLGGWNRNSGYAGEQPAHMLAWSKELAGFIRPEKAGAGLNDVSLRALSDAGDALEVVLDDYRHGERLLLEYRFQSGFDSGLPGSGVLVSRVNDRVGFGSLSSGIQGSGRLLTIEEADGRYDLASNSNLGEASDVFRTLSAELQFSAEAGAEGGKAVELLTVETSQVAAMSLLLSRASQGSNIGLDELPPNAVFGSYGGSVSIRMTLDSGSSSQADGVDFFAMGDGRVSLQLTGMDGQVLAATGKQSVAAGWNRLLFPLAADISAQSDVILMVEASAGGLYAPLATDAQGMASGLTEILDNGSYVVAPFDASIRLLVTGADGADSAAGNIQPAATDTVAPASSSSSSGGGFFRPFWLLLLAVFLRRRS